MRARGPCRCGGYSSRRDWWKWWCVQPWMTGVAFQQMSSGSRGYYFGRRGLPVRCSQCSSELCLCLSFTYWWWGLLILWVLITNGFPALAYVEVEEDPGKECEDCEDCWASFEREREAGSGKSAIVMEDVESRTSAVWALILQVTSGPGHYRTSRHRLFWSSCLYPALTHFQIFFVKKNSDRKI